ncbi:MAG: radical SAM protein [bacterium]|nr:radical SAM protein [bacterium]
MNTETPISIEPELVSPAPARYTLRQEYFGGLVYDSKRAKVELLSPEEYQLLAGVAAGSVASDVVGDGTERFSSLGWVTSEGGVLVAQSMRSVKPPDKLPERSLTAPIRVFDSNTLQCNFACPHCFFSCNIFVEEERRTPEQTEEVLRKFYDAGTMEWRFTGGEALVHPDVLDSIAVAKDLGMNVGLYSNGWWSPKIARGVLESGIDELTISIEGQEEINDKRREPGSYKRLMNTFDLINGHNKEKPDKAIDVTLATAVGADNVQDVPFLARLAAKYGFNINFMPLKPSGRARDFLSGEMMSVPEYMQFAYVVEQLRHIPEVKDAGTKIIFKYKDLFCPEYPNKANLPFPFDYSECGAITTAISLMPDGTTFTCPFILDFDDEGHFLGPNITDPDVSVADAWFHPNLASFRHVERPMCEGCGLYKTQCRGACKATVLGGGGRIQDGVLIGEDRYCFKDMMGEFNPETDFTLIPLEELLRDTSF